MSSGWGFSPELQEPSHPDPASLALVLMAGEVTHTGHTPEPGKMQAGVPVARKYVGLTVKGVPALPWHHHRDLGQLAGLPRWPLSDLSSSRHFSPSSLHGSFPPNAQQEPPTENQTDAGFCGFKGEC